MQKTDIQYNKSDKLIDLYFMVIFDRQNLIDCGFLLFERLCLSSMLLTRQRDGGVVAVGNGTRSCYLWKHEPFRKANGMR